MATRSRGAKKAASGGANTRSAREQANSPERHNPEQGSRAISGEVEERAIDSAPEGVDVGDARQLPGAEDAEKRDYGVPAPTPESAPLNPDDPKAVQKYREEAHERAEETRALGNGAEPQRFNKGATD
jgi:hypothetical protein